MAAAHSGGEGGGGCHGRCAEQADATAPCAVCVCCRRIRRRLSKRASGFSPHALAAWQGHVLFARARKTCLIPVRCCHVSGLLLIVRQPSPADACAAPRPIAMGREEGLAPHLRPPGHNCMVSTGHSVTSNAGCIYEAWSSRSVGLRSCGRGRSGCARVWSATGVCVTARRAA